MGFNSVVKINNLYKEFYLKIYLIKSKTIKCKFQNR